MTIDELKNEITDFLTESGVNAPYKLYVGYSGDYQQRVAIETTYVTKDLLDKIAERFGEYSIFSGGANGRDLFSIELRVRFED